jgi:predicted ABC-type ATPase
MPAFCLIGGPNGSGKSSLVHPLVKLDFFRRIDPDAIAYSLNPDDPTSVAVSAGREAIRLERQFLEQRVDFAVETTLSGNGPLALLRKAKGAGSYTRSIYVCLDDVGINFNRVSLRVSKGGHHVPQEDIRRRYDRSLANAPMAIEIVNEPLIFDNSSCQPAPVLIAQNGQINWQAPNLPPWAASILSHFR